MRGYDEWLASVFDVVGAGWVTLILLAVAIGGGLLWYFFPRWVPRRFPRIRLPRIRRPKLRFPRIRRPRFRWPRFRWPRFKRKPKKTKAPEPVPEITEEVEKEAEPVVEAQPEPVKVPVLSLADRLAAEGRYDEAIRERLRESVATLTRFGVIAPAAAWTAQEVAATAGANRPAVSEPLAGATDIFSQVWYGRRPAGPDNDAQMRRLTAEVKAALESWR